MKLLEVIRSSRLVSVMFSLSVGLVIFLGIDMVFDNKIPTMSDIIFTVVASTLIGLMAYDINKFRDKEKSKKEAS